jgi:hypothetical protein
MIKRVTRRLYPSNNVQIAIRHPFIILMFLLMAFSARDGYGSSLLDHCVIAGSGMRTVSDVVKQLSYSVDARLKPYFDLAGVAYPPRQMTLIALKEEMRLELWAMKDNAWVFIRTYQVSAASGVQGPKQKRGDGQVPEGIYQISTLNPNSAYHLSMKLNYPNSYDLTVAQFDNRSNLGGDIYIHGRAKSAGCLAIGDSAIEDMFVLVAKA